MEKLAPSEFIEAIKRKPTPDYDEVVKEMEWVTNKMLEFNKKCPTWKKDGLTANHLLFKAMVDYQMTLKEYTRRSYMRFFNSLYYEETRDMDYSAIYGDEVGMTEEGLKIVKKYQKMIELYKYIREVLSRDYIHNYAKCGCIKCRRETYAECFVRKMPFICPDCRRVIHLWKKASKELLQWSNISNDEYEARIKDGPPEKYFHRIPKN